mgnify:CR=1 FL=1
MTAHGLSGEMTLPCLLKSNESIYLSSKHSPAAFNFTYHWVYSQIGKPLDKKCIDQNYVRISCGYDFSDASPIKGVKLNYLGEEDLNFKLDINTEQ